MVIDECTEHINSNTEAIKNNTQAAHKAEWDKFDKSMEKYTNANTEYDFYLGMIDQDKIYNYNSAELSDQGKAYGILNYYKYKDNLSEMDDIYSEYTDIRTKAEQGIDGYSLDDPNVQNRLKQLKEQMQSLGNENLQLADTFKSLVEQGIQKAIDKMKELIDEYENTLDAEKDLYDYQNTISEKTDNINSLKKQLSAYNGDNSQQGKGNIQKLTSQLKDAQKELQDTERERTIAQQKSILEDLMNQYQSFMDNELYNLTADVEKCIDYLGLNVNNTAGISELLASLASGNGYNMTNFIINRIAQNGEPSTLTSADVYQNEKHFSIKQYYTGKKNIDEDELAWTQEQGEEYIIRKSDGAILTPLAKSDMVLNDVATENLWRLANNPLVFAKNLSTPSVNITPNTNNMNAVSNSITMNVQIDHVQDYNDFMRQMRNDKNAEKMIQEMTVGRIAGGSKLAKYNHKF